MKTLHKKGLQMLTAIFVLVGYSCVSDAWKDHYDIEESGTSGSSLSEYISQDSSLSTFWKMMQKTGYDNVLDEPQTYTVWAPVNSALTGLNLMDTSTIGEIVRNHIARFTFPTSGFRTDSLKKVYLLSGKFVPFQQMVSGFRFGGNSIHDGSLLARNGILHIIDGYVPYSSNIWEYLSRTAGLDSIRSFLVPLGSTPYADINNEDSVYTAILPSNAGWIRAYDFIKNYYKCFSSGGARDSSAAKQRRLTCNAILQDAFFKTTVSDPAAYDSLTLVNTSNHAFTNASRLFKGATKNILSNGILYLTDTLKNQSTESWNRVITLEAENAKYGRFGQNANLYARSGENSGHEVSGNRYIVASPLTTSDVSKISVRFPIPNTLSTRYKIYCTFVPQGITETPLPCLVRFYVDYLNSSGVLLQKVALNSGVITSGTAMMKVLAGEVNLPYCNIWDGTNTSDILVRLTVENSASKTQTTIYTRTMRIDCITLEPVN